MFGLLPVNLVPPAEVLEAAAAAPSLILPISAWQRTTVGYLLCWVCAAWMYLLVRPRPIGSAIRVLLAAPVVAAQLAVTPFLVDRATATVLITPVTGIFSIVAFKAAAYSLGRGPLLLMDCQGFLKYAAVLTMPVIPRAVFCISGGRTDTTSQSPASGWDFLRMYGTKAAGATLAAVITQVPQVPILVCHWFYALCLSLSLGALWDFWCLVALVAFGVEVAPSFDKPWLSTSFADYWSRRWNLTVTYMLRVLIYEPVMQGSLAAPQKASSPLQQQQQQLGGPSPASPTAADGTASPTSSCSCHSGVLVDASVSPSAAAKPAAGAAASVPAPAPEGAEESESDMDSAMSHLEGLRRRRLAASKPSQLQQDQTTLGHVSNSKDQQLGSSAVGMPAGSKQFTPSSSSGSSRNRKLLRRYLALQATFAFSGAWHALIFYYNTGLWTWHWFAFFTVQAPIVTAESLLIKAATKAGWQLPRGVSIFLTNLLLIVVANPLFFGPCDWSGMCANMMGTFKAKAE